VLALVQQRSFPCLAILLVFNVAFLLQRSDELILQAICIKWFEWRSGVLR